MDLQLTRPICFFDLETTGVNVTNDRIVEICVHKVHPDGKEETHNWRVNPTIPIPDGASAIHGIYDADVADKPTFAALAAEAQVEAWSSRERQLGSGPSIMLNSVARRKLNAT